MRGTVATVVVVGALLAAARGAGAQVVMPQPGAKVRVDAPSAGVRRFEGTVIAAGDTLDVASGGARVRVPVAAITRLELSRGRSRARGAATGAVWGTGIGLVVGLATQSVADDDCTGPDTSSPGCDDISRGEYVVASTFGGAFWGAIIGAIAGRERWDVVTLPGARSATIVPWVAPGGRAGLVVALAR